MKQFKKRFKTPRTKRHFRIRKKLAGTTVRPRLCVFRSTKHIYAQVVDDEQGSTILSACTLMKNLPEIEGDDSHKIKQAKAVGKLIAIKLQEKGLDKVVFDRGGYLYHGRVAALAQGVRDGGIQI